MKMTRAIMHYNALDDTDISKKSSTETLVSIVILNLERSDDLKRNIESLKKTVSVPYEVIIVDNGSKQKATLNYLREIDNQPTGKSGMISVHYNKTNLGCSGGRKLGTELALKSKSKYILTVDNDVTYMPDWLDKLILAIQKSEKIGAVSPLILNPHRDSKLRVFWNGGKLKIIDNYFMELIYIDGGGHRDWFGGKVYGEDQLKGQIECDWLLGTALLIKKDVAEKISHNTSYLSDFEDYDYSLQIAELGYKMLNIPDSIIIHHPIMLQGRMKRMKKTSYTQARYNPLRKFDSLMAFVERTGFNIVRETEFYNRRYNKYFLTKKNYPDLLGQDKSFNDVDVKEVRKAFETITNERIKRGIAAEGKIDMKRAFENTSVIMNEKIKLSLIICSKNRSTQLKRCLESIRQEEMLQVSGELILVNNGSADNTEEAMTLFKENSPFPVEIVSEPRPGLGRARNAGILKSKGDILVFTDDDCYLAQGYLTKASKVFESGDFHYCGGRILLYDKTDVMYTVDYRDKYAIIPPYSIVYPGRISGCNMIIHRKVINTIGLFDPMFGPGTPFCCDDIDYLTRASLFGFTGARIPELVVYHHHARKHFAIKGLMKYYAYGRGAFSMKFILKGKFMAIKYWIPLFGYSTDASKTDLDLYLQTRFLLLITEIWGGISYFFVLLKRTLTRKND
ncbi:MAG: glycosyltransferase family 2 protein [Candidatus Omnitrophota bacterium]|nr:glycosyltransferase family 2 protein [Candidatus Omnitrophota bacterium]